MKKNLVLQLVLFAAAVCTLSGCVKLDTKKPTTSSGNALNWTQSSSLSTENVYQMVVSGTTVYAATSAGLYSSTNSGTSWTLVGGGLPANTSITNIALSGSNMYVGTSSGIYYSTNSGTSWTATAGSTVVLVTALAVSGSNLFAGNPVGVYLSTDNGTTWTTVTTGLPSNGDILSLTISGNNIFAGVAIENGNGGGVGTNVYLSTNNGTSWTAVGTGLPQVANLNCITVTGSTLYAGITGYTNADVPSGSGIYTSTNSGASWTALGTSGLPPFTIFTAFSLASSGNNLFAGFDFDGVYLSTNNGSSWTSVGNTLTSDVTAGCIAIVGNTIIMGDNFGEKGIFTATF